MNEPSMDNPARETVRRLHILRTRFLFLLEIALLCLAWPAQASADPLGFHRPRATFALGLDAFDALTGEFGKISDVGMSVFAEATLQFGGYYGAHIRLGSARAFTKKDFLPYDNGYQYVYFVAAPRFFLAPFRKLNLFFYLQPEIALNVLTSNTLVKYTGNRSATGAAGGSLGAQFIISLLSVSAQLTCQYNWNLHTVTLGGSLSFGITSTIH